MSVFESTTVEALDVETSALLKLITFDAAHCGHHAAPLLSSALDSRPWVAVNTGEIPQENARGRDRVGQFLCRLPSARNADGDVRIACPTPAVAENTAALLRGLGAPAHAIYLGGY